MINFILILLCLSTGMLFRYSKTLPPDAYKGINAWVIYIALPAVSFKYLPHIQWTHEMLFPALSPLIVWMVAWVAVTLFARYRRPDASTVGAMKLTCGMANTSFLGFPLIMAYFSESFIGTAIICDQITFVLLSTVGLVTAIRASGKEELSVKVIVKRLITFPPFLGCSAALIIPHFVDISLLYPLFDKLGATVAPLALFSIGLQLSFGNWKGEIPELLYGLVIKLFLAPLAVWGVAKALNLSGHIMQVSVFEAAMPALVSSAILTERYDLNPRLSGLFVGIGIVVAFASTAFWWWVLTRF